MLSLNEKGFNVTLVDRDEPSEATSFGNAGSFPSGRASLNLCLGFGKKFRSGCLIHQARYQLGGRTSLGCYLG